MIRDSSTSTTALSESKLHTKALQDYVINVADGCTHSCEFCYNKAAPQYRFDPGDKLANAGIDDPAGQWGDYVLYRDELPQHLARDLKRHRENGTWKTTHRGQGIVGLSFATDCFMDRHAAQLTAAAITLLAVDERPIRVLTRKPMVAATLHGPLFETVAERGLITAGTSLPTLNNDLLGVIEPGAPPADRRVTGLAQLERLGVPVFVSVSPTYPTMTKADLRAVFERIYDVLNPTVIFHEPVNPRAGNLEDCIAAAEAAGLNNLATGFQSLTNPDEWIAYALRHLRWAQELAVELDLPLRLWPDKTIETQASSKDEREWVAAWRQRPTPEEIGDGPACADPYPDLPTQQGTLDDYTTTA
jgi:DNA repair photolyase